MMKKGTNKLNVVFEVNNLKFSLFFIDRLPSTEVYSFPSKHFVHRLKFPLNIDDRLFVALKTTNDKNVFQMRSRLILHHSQERSTL